MTEVGVTDVAAGARDILHFWFEEVGPDRWWVRSAETDAAIVARFQPLWEEWRSRLDADFLATPHQALAAVILFDQFPRNIFRGRPEAFATDALALDLAKGALERDYDAELSPTELSFLYMPFMHSEELADQDRSVDLFGRLGLEEPFAYAQRHRDVIARVGRFPARNAALGRADMPGEAEVIAETRDW